MGNQPATPEELPHSQILTVDALLRMLEQKGVVKKEEILAEVVKLQQELGGETKTLVPGKSANNSGISSCSFETRQGFRPNL